MDMIGRLGLAGVIGVFLLPAWAVFRLPRLVVAVPVGALIFWTWLFLPGVLLQEWDPTYDSFGPAFSLLFGLPWGFGYCGFWAIVRTGVPRLKNRVRRPGTILDLVIWSGVALFCVSFPWLASAKYHRALADDLGYTLSGAGPLFLLAVALAATAYLSLPRQGKAVPHPSPLPPQLSTT